ncbi:BTAD domain-containing putative transcriptional regulator [Kitasatospora sp. HPMI-4]|uniref:AfsR/SARP family transcriptional regulator n=1 Tax=Kitasatospora sp. HPMI-4 TaxID=3448443 RepID=UPI003F1AE625
MLHHLATPRSQPSAVTNRDSATVRFRVLGELAVEIDDRPVPLGPIKRRLLLGTLLCRANTTVSTDVLTEALWSDEPPRSARKNLQAYVSALRKLLGPAGGPDRLVHKPAGYLLRVDPAELDLLRFEELARAGRQAGRLGGGAHAARLLREALDLGNGPLLDDLVHGDVIGGEAVRYANRRLAVHEDWAEAELAAGRPALVAEQLAELVAEYPMRERLCAAQMTALYRAGRQSEALAVYDNLRQLLAGQLGLRASPALEAHYRAILNGRDGGDGKHPPAAATRRSPAAPHQERPPAVLPADLPDFTGRTDQVHALADLLAGEGRLVVISGPVGTGKSALAVHVAHRLERQYPDGRISVRLRRDDGTPRHTGSVMAELARITGLVETVRPEDEEEVAAVWRSWLAARRVLVVLDDAPDESAVRHLLPGAGPSSVMITSRSRMAGLGPHHLLELPSYSQAEAVELLARIVGENRVPADRDAAERIVAAVGRLPLAVRVSGSKLAVQRQLPLADYARRLEQSGSLLDELVAGDLAVRTRLAEWWGGLPQVVRGVLRRLAALPSPLFSLAEAVTALGCGEQTAQRVLEGMIEISVLSCPVAEVSAHAALYELPALAQSYIREQAELP